MAETDAALIGEIRAAHAASRGTYGAPRIRAELTAKGIRVGRKRVARLLLQTFLAGASRRKFVVTTVKSDSRQAPDLVKRDFTASVPDRRWVADITYVPTWAGFFYLAVVLDAFSRRIVGWSMATTLAARLVLDALNMALMTRRPRGVIHHSVDQEMLVRQQCLDRSWFSCNSLNLIRLLLLISETEPGANISSRNADYRQYLGHNLGLFPQPARDRLR